MTNPNDAIGTNAAYGTRTSVNAFNDIAQLVNGRGILNGFSVVPKSGMTVSVGGVAGTRDVAVAEDNLGNRTCINNRSVSAVDITLEAASVSANRYDAIVVYANNPAQASDITPDAPSVCGIIAVEGGTTGVSEAQIRSAITADGGTGSVAYYAVVATIYVGAGTTTITSSNISQSHIAISASDIADGEIATRMIADGAIATDKVADGAITPAKLSFGQYSSSEQVVGAWVDGRPIYRKVITGTTSSSVGEEVNPNIQNLYAVLTVGGFIISATGTSQPIPRIVPDAVAGYSIGVGDISASRMWFQHPANAYQGKEYAIILTYIKSS